MKKRHLPRLLKWRSLGLLLLGLLVAGGLLLYRLRSLAPNLSPSEQALVTASRGWRIILHDPTNLPLKVLERLTFYIPLHQPVLFARLPSVLIALLGLGLLVYVLHRWYGPRSMVLGFIMFVCSAWFLHVARFTGPDIEYLTGILALLAVQAGLADNDDRPLMLYVWLLTNIILLFIPGMVWFVVLSCVWQWRVLVDAWNSLDTIINRALWSLLPLIALAAIVYGIVRDSALLLPWLGLPSHLTLALWHPILNNLGNTLAAFAFRGPHRPELWLGQLPAIDSFIDIMLLAGILFYAKHWQAARTRLLAAYAVLGVLLIGIGGVVTLSVLVPIAYVIATAGVAYVLHTWLEVFPRNPVARATGIAIVVAVIGLSCVYNLGQYYIAWPHNPETAAIYQR